MSDYEKKEKLKDIEIENNIWIIYIVIIILSWYANYKEKKYILYDDSIAMKEYQNIMIFIFSVLVIIYYYFANDSYMDMKKLNMNDNLKKKVLITMSFLGSFLVLLSGIIFLMIVIYDDNIDTEIAFN